MKKTHFINADIFHGEKIPSFKILFLNEVTVKLKGKLQLCETALFQKWVRGNAGTG